MKVEKRGGYSDKVNCLAGFLGGFLASVKCLWSEGAKLLAHGLESFGKIFERFAVNFQRVGVNCNSFWSQKINGSLDRKSRYPRDRSWLSFIMTLQKKVFIRKCSTEKFIMYKRTWLLLLSWNKTFHEVEIFIILKVFKNLKFRSFYGRRILAK